MQFLKVVRFAPALGLLVLAMGSAQAQTHPPDLTGIFGRDVHGFNKPYEPRGAAERGAEVKDGYNNEYLRPWVVELLNRDALVTSSGQAVITAHSVCYPEGIPYVYGGAVMQILQTPNEVTMLFGDAGLFRTVYLNRPHSEHVVPSYWGESVGHFEGDTLVIDTIGIAVNPQAGSMGFYGTPHTGALHVVERWRYLREGEVSTAPPSRNNSYNVADIIEGKKHMRLTFTVDDPLAYKKPWSVTLDYVPVRGRLREYICAENSRSTQINPLLPTAVIPDF